MANEIAKVQRQIMRLKTKEKRKPLTHIDLGRKSMPKKDK